MRQEVETDVRLERRVFGDSKGQFVAQPSLRIVSDGANLSLWVCLLSNDSLSQIECSAPARMPLQL